jgi:hypothetical protein
MRGVVGKNFQQMSRQTRVSAPVHTNKSLMAGKNKKYHRSLFDFVNLSLFFFEKLVISKNTLKNRGI